MISSSFHCRTSLTHCVSSRILRAFSSRRVWRRVNARAKWILEDSFGRKQLTSWLPCRSQASRRVSTKRSKQRGWNEVRREHETYRIHEGEESFSWIRRFFYSCFSIRIGIIFITWKINWTDILFISIILHWDKIVRSFRCLSWGFCPLLTWLNKIALFLSIL